jgi:hypothetical protein
MRLNHRSAFGWIFGGTVAIAGGFAGAACSGNDFNGCAATRTCGSPAGGSSGFSNAGHGGESAGGKVGQGGAGGFAGKAGGGSHDNGQAGEAAAGQGGEGEPAPGRGTGGGDTGNGDRGSVEEAGTSGARDDVSDTTAPAIANVTPVNGATGVTSDAPIVVEFDEPMDEEATEAAFQSSDLPVDSVEFSWRNHDKTFVIRPKAPLAYAATNVGGDAKHYVFTIAKTATDAAGNRLAADHTSYFTTLRDVTQTLTNAATENYAYEDAGIGFFLQDTLGTVGRVPLGDTDSNRGELAVTTFDLTGIPANIVSWESASVAVSFGPNAGDPFGDDFLGPLHVFTSTADPAAYTRAVPPVDLGVLATSENSTRCSADITSAVAGDYANLAERGNVLELVFKFEKRSNGDDLGQSVLLDCTATELTLNYLLP